MVWHHGVGGLGLIGDTCPDSLHDTCHRQSLTTYLKKLVLGLVPTPGSIPGAGTLQTIWYPRSRGFQIVLSSILVPDYLSKFIDMHSAAVESYLIIYGVIRTVIQICSTRFS